MRELLRSIIEFFVGNPNFDSGNRAEMNRRIRAITGRDPNECRALMVIPK